MKPLAITGGIAEGKSTVLAMLAERGWPTLSADEVARSVLDIDEVRAQVAHELDLDAAFTRSQVLARVVADHGARRRLNSVLHGEVWDRILDSGARAVEMPLLVEACLVGRFSRIWCVTCGEAEQRRRLVERLGDARQAALLLATQLPTEVKSAFADAIVRTDRPMPDVQSCVMALADRLEAE